MRPADTRGAGTEHGRFQTRSRLLVLLALASALGARAQDGPPPPAPPPAWADVLTEDPTVPTDTLAALPAPDSLLAAYRADADFQYENPQAAGPTLWERFRHWVYRTFVAPIFENTSAGVRDVVFVVLAVLGLAWVVTRLLRAEGGSPFSRRDRARAEAGPLLDVDDIEAVDLRARLADALRQSSYREAVRYRYLVLLQRMAEAGAIDWRRDKTNRDYLAEARAHDAALGRALAPATRVFDYVWYGERPVDADRYAALAPTFERAEAALPPRPVAS